MGLVTLIDTRPPAYGFICVHGDTRAFKLAATYFLAGVSTVYPLTGDSITVLVRANPTDPDADALITATVGNGQLVITDGPNGLFTWTIPAALTAGPAGFVTFPPWTQFWWVAKVLSGINETVASGWILWDERGMNAVS